MEARDRWGQTPVSARGVFEGLAGLAVTVGSIALGIPWLAVVVFVVLGVVGLLIIGVRAL